MDFSLVKPEQITFLLFLNIIEILSRIKIQNRTLKYVLGRENLLKQLASGWYNYSRYHARETLTNYQGVRTVYSWTLRPRFLFWLYP